MEGLGGYRSYLLGGGVLILSICISIGRLGVVLKWPEGLVFRA